MSSSEQRTPDLSVVIPVHNSATVLELTIAKWTEHLTSGLTEVIIVENGSIDDSWQIAQNTAHDTEFVRFSLMQSPKGMGNALRAGIASSVGARVLLTADDLPFGFDDLEQAAALQNTPTIVIGSKAHPLSQVERGLMRSITTWGYRTMRRVILGSKVGDSQGTILADGKWLRAVAPKCQDAGFLFTTQLIFAAEAQKLAITEVPVRLSADHAPKASSVRISDVWKMALGLIGLRRTRATYTSEWNHK